MTPIFAVQATGRDDTEIALTVDALNRLGYEWIDFGLIYFSNEITNLDSFPMDRPVIPLAGTKILDLWRDGHVPANWKIWYDDFLMDQFFAKDILREYLLNAESEVYRFEQVIDMTFQEDRFIKPTTDGKIFAGAVLPAGTSLRQHLETVTHQKIPEKDTVLVAPVIEIDREFRCIVVDNRVVGVSEYKSAAGIKAKLVDDATRRALEAYINALPVEIPLAGVDLCEVLNPDGTVKCWKIVEINCFHCCGLYKTDRVAVFEALFNAVKEIKI